MKIVRKNKTEYSSLQPGDVFAYTLTDVDQENVYMVIDEINGAGLYKYVNMESGNVVSNSTSFDVIKLSPTLYLNV